MIYFITGGARSGKSSFASQLALKLSSNPVYVATARRWDSDFEKRIARHVADRDERWTTIEEEKQISRHDLTGKVVVIDCVTLWLSNLFFDAKNDVEKSLEAFKNEIDKIKKIDATFLIVSNELGMGVHAESEIGRKFTDLQGWANQHTATLSDEVFLMVSGIPVNIKSKGQTLKLT